MQLPYRPTLTELKPFAEESFSNVGGIPGGIHYEFNRDRGSFRLRDESGYEIFPSSYVCSLREKAEDRRGIREPIETGMVLCLSSNEPAFQEVRAVLQKYQTPTKSGEEQ